MLPHVPSDTKANCQYFWRDDCLHGLSGKSHAGKKKECRSIHPQLCWAFLRHGYGRNGCQGSKICGQAHPQICKASWGTGKWAGKDTCRAGYHIGEKPGQPKGPSEIQWYTIRMNKIKNKGQSQTRNHGTKQWRKAPNKLAKNPTNSNNITRKE